MFEYMPHVAHNLRVARPTPPRVRRARRRLVPARGCAATDGLSQALANGTFATLVRYFAVRPDGAPHLRALMREFGLGTRSLQRELTRMERLGLITLDRSAAPRVRVRAIAGNPAWAPLRALVRAYANPADLLRVTLAGVPRVSAAFIFGSVARGVAQPDSDCDVFVLTSPGLSDAERRDVVEALAVQTLDTSLALGREVEFIVLRPEDVRHQRERGMQFVTRVLRAPKQWILGDRTRVAATLGSIKPPLRRTAP
jgi:predicted nucleotidyltransferase